MPWPMIQTGQSSAGWYIQFNGLNREALQQVLGTLVEDCLPDGTMIYHLNPSTLTDLQARQWFIMFNQANKTVPDEIV